MSIGIGALVACAVVGLLVAAYTKRTTKWGGSSPTLAESVRAGAIVMVALATAVLVVWLIVAVPVSAYARNNCRREADGYGLGYDWSFRNNCRIELPTGQLVPSSKIRITSEGEIIAGEDI
jgi:hypothetical protein